MELVNRAFVGDDIREAVGELLSACADEFVPPLSQRYSTSQADLGSVQGSPFPDAYFNVMRDQSIICAFEGEVLAGFLSYVEGYELACLGGPSTYVTTLCVAAGLRRRGVASALYRHLESVVGTGVVSLRTWSTNVAQTEALRRLGYRCVGRVVDDRGPGIDTMYFAKRVGNAEALPSRGHGDSGTGPLG